MAEVEIGLGKSGRRAYGFDDIAIVPSRRTRDPEDVDISWEIDAFRFDLPVLAAQGEPRHRHGVAEVPGLYFLGLPWLSKMNSSFLSGVADDATRLADHIRTARLRRP